MRFRLISFLFVLIPAKLFATAQIPDLLIYDGDTLQLHTNPLEDFYDDENTRPNHFYVGGFSTACWRGYQAIWEIIDNKMYLNAIQDCFLRYPYKITEKSLLELNPVLPEDILAALKKLQGKGYDKRYLSKLLKKQIGRKKLEKYGSLIFRHCKVEKRRAPLGILFPDHYENGKVHAFWYTGKLIAPKGKLLSYVHMGYNSIYEKELILEVKKGVVLDVVEYDNRLEEIKPGYGILEATSYSLVAPVELIRSRSGHEYILSDTIDRSNIDQSITLNAYAVFNQERKNQKEKLRLAELTIDSLKSVHSKDFLFSNKRMEKLHCGTACWIDGTNSKNGEKIRILAIANINSLMLLYYKEIIVNEKDFTINADYITHSVEMKEFGF